MNLTHLQQPPGARVLRQRLPMPAYEPPPRYSPFLERMLGRAKQSLEEEFQGITADGSVRAGLFPLRRTGLSIAPIVRAARDLLAMLEAQQQRRISFDIESSAWRAWSNVHPFLMRHGLSLHELAPTQRGAALELVKSALSAGGFETTRNVMKLNEHARELTGLGAEYGEWYYWLSIFGAPSESEPWGWQLDGHHLIINCFMLGDQLVLTPQFMGSEPVLAQFGKYAGTQVFRAEEAVGLAMMRELSPEQQAKAIIGTLLPGEVLTAAYNDNVRMPYEGIRYDDLSSKQQRLLGPFNFGELHVCRQVQAHRSAGHRSRYGIGEHRARRLWTGGRERAQSGRSKHAGPVDCLIIWTQPVGLAYRRRLAVDEEHRGARTTRINRAMQAVGERGSAPDHGHAQPAAGIGVSVSHGYGAVLVSCAVEPCPRSVQRCRE